MPRRMGRRGRLPRLLLNAATGVSLVLFAATVALWMRSYEVHDVFWTERRWTSGPFWRVERREYYAADGVAGVVTIDR